MYSIIQMVEWKTEGTVVCLWGSKDEGRNFLKHMPLLSNVKNMLTVSLLVDLTSERAEYELAFLHASLEDDVYVEMPICLQEPGRIIKSYCMD